MARPFMFAALCQRAYPLKHSLAESIFVSRVQKNREKKLRQQKNSLTGSLVSRVITVYSTDSLFIPQSKGSNVFHKSGSYFNFQGVEIRHEASSVTMDSEWKIQLPGVCVPWLFVIYFIINIFYIWSDYPLKRRIKSHLPFANVIRSSPYSPRQQDKGYISLTQYRETHMKFQSHRYRSEAAQETYLSREDNIKNDS